MTKKQKRKTPIQSLMMRLLLPLLLLYITRIKRTLRVRRIYKY